MIKAILFDLGQTLVDSADGFRAAEKEAQVKIFSDIAVTSWEEFLSKYRELRKNFHKKSNFSRTAMWKALYEHYYQETDMKLLKKLEDEYWKKVKAETRLFPETYQVLKALSPNYQLALITNAQGENTWEKHRLRKFPKLEMLFKVIIVAGEFGIPPKPDPVPFLKCLERLDIDYSEAVYVGDDWRIDICGARNVGIQPIWIQHESVGRSWPAEETSVPIITTLNPLLNFESILP
ncbi:MAG: HAD family hydrolase [Desulfobacteraceae bacterium]|nr:HAD family hydrolase [Desulfobacteraceae bacterium]